MSQGFTPPSGGGFGVPPGGFTGGTQFTTPNSGGGMNAFTSGATTSGATLKQTYLPVGRLVPGLICGAVAVILNVVLFFSSVVATDTTWGVVAVVAWLLAGVIGTTFLGGYFTEVNRRRGAGIYMERPGPKFIYRLMWVLLIVGVLLSAWNIAQWVGKW